MKPKKRRKGQPIKNRLKKFKILYLNIRGMKSKINSLNDILEEIQPAIFCITETHLMEKEKLDIDEDDYEVFRNDRNQDGGGVLIGVERRLAHLTTIVEKKKEVEESLWVVMNNNQLPLRIGVVYAPQESRTAKEKYEEMYKSLDEQISMAKQNNQKLLLVGDFNCKIGEKIPGNDEEISVSGKDFLKMIERNKLQVANTMEMCKGLWTREEGGSRSVLDYVIIDQEDKETILEMMVDEEKEFAPTGKSRSGEETTSDHNTILAKFNWMIQAEKKVQIPKTIITKKGYQNIKRGIKERRLLDILKKEEPLQEVYKDWKEEINKLTEENQTKVKKNNKRKSIKLLIKARKDLRKQCKHAEATERYKLVARMKMLNEEIERENHNQFRMKIDKVVARLQGRNGINIGNMWQVAKKIKRKKEEPPTAIKSKEGKVLEDPELIKDRYLEHFAEILKNVPAETEEERKQEEFINSAFEKIVQIAKSKEPVLTTKEEVQMAVKELKRNKCKDKTGWQNELVLETGEEMIECLHGMMNKMEKERAVPEPWNEVKVKAVGKKGSVLEMDNKRGLFITDILSKIYEKVMKNRNNEKITNYVSDYQMGGVKERAPVDNIILLSEVIRQKRKLGKKCYIMFGDAVKCFDKLWLKDSLVELYKAGCNVQDIHMMYKMNENTVIEVETPFGTTEKITVGDVVKQGTVLGPTLCCVAIDQINQVGEHQERSIGKEFIAILVFVDDVMSAGSPEDIRKGIRSCRKMEQLKKVTYGLKKTKYMILNTGREEDEEITEEVNKGRVGSTDEYRYVGFELDKMGNCMYHIEQKGKENNGQIVALKSLASYRNVGSKFIMVRLQLYESCIVKSLLYNLEGWNKQTKKEIKKLEQQQAKALCQIMEIPISTPYLGLLNELGIWRVEERLAYRRIMLMQNILKSDDRRLSKRVILDQKEEDEEDTIYRTAKDLLAKYKVDIDEIANMEKSKLKAIVKERINEEMGNMVEKAAGKMKKLRFVEAEKFKRKRYVEEMDGYETIQTVKTRLNMLTVYGNYKADVTLQQKCPYCNIEEDTTEHTIECRELGQSIVGREDLKNTDNIQLWKLINERTKFNMDNRSSRKGKN